MNPAAVRRLSRSNMEALTTALEAGRAVPPYTRIELQPFVGASLAEPLAVELSRLAADMCVNIQRASSGNMSDTELVAACGCTFYREIWPGIRKPQVFYDPRSLLRGGTERACQHAKCVVIGQEKLLVTSANFTEAAHRRNIEVGVLLGTPALALEAVQQFETPIWGKRLLPLPAG